MDTHIAPKEPTAAVDPVKKKILIKSPELHKRTQECRGTLPGSHTHTHTHTHPDSPELDGLPHLNTHLNVPGNDGRETTTTSSRGGRLPRTTPATAMTAAREREREREGERERVMI